jgi:hypothetical protein
VASRRRWLLLSGLGALGLAAAADRRGDVDPAIVV